MSKKEFLSVDDLPQLFRAQAQGRAKRFLDVMPEGELLFYDPMETARHMGGKMPVQVFSINDVRAFQATALEICADKQQEEFDPAGHEKYAIEAEEYARAIAKYECEFPNS